MPIVANPGDGTDRVSYHDDLTAKLNDVHGDKCPKDEWVIHASEGSENVYLTAPQIKGLPPQKPEYYRSSTKCSNVFENACALIEHYLAINNCEHQWSPQKDKHQQDYPDGRATCVKCHINARDLLPKTARKVISDSMAGDVVAQQPWPEEIGIQGGESGVVLSPKGNYKTAFVEVFFDVDDEGVYVRGESDNLIAAEKECWDKYRSIMACEQHEWSREINGRLREDGYAQCIHCHVKGSFLEPLTVCDTCGKKTKNLLGERHLCYKDMYALPVDDYVKELKAHREPLGLFSKEREVTVRFLYPIKQAAVKLKGDDYLEKNIGVMAKLYSKLSFKFSEVLTGDELAEITDLESLEDPRVLSLQRSVIEGLPQILPD